MILERIPTMICPKCGSENVQYSTKTSGGGYSAGNGCCGYMFLGPLGLLCGACGSQTETDEFWVCNKCGHKFSDNEAKKTMQSKEQIAVAYEKYKKELTEPLSYYKNQLDSVNTKAKAAQRKYEQDFNSLVNKYASENKKVKKYLKKSQKELSRLGCWTLILLFLIGAIACAVGLIPVGATILIGLAVFGIVRAIRKSYANYSLEWLLGELEPSFKETIQQKEKAEKDVEYWQNYVKKAEFVKNYDETSNS